MAVKDVHITISNFQYVASPDPVTLSKGGGDTIKWYNDTTDALTIEFVTSPFQSNRNPYSVPAGQTVSSGNVVANAGTQWTYSIKSSEIMGDPQVIIER